MSHLPRTIDCMGYDGELLRGLVEDAPRREAYDRIQHALEEHQAELEAARLARAIEAGELPAGTTIDDLTPEQQVWYLDRDPEDVGLPADFGMVDE